MTQPSEKPRVVIDTNLFVSGTIFKRGNPHALLTAWSASAYTLLLSARQNHELTDVFSRPKLVDRYRLSENELATLFDRLAAASHVQPSPTIPVHLRDPKDVHILAAALGGNADYVITGDHDLHEVAGDPRLGALRIVTVRDFLEILKDSGLWDGI